MNSLVAQVCYSLLYSSVDIWLFSILVLHPEGVYKQLYLWKKWEREYYIFNKNQILSAPGIPWKYRNKVKQIILRIRIASRDNQTGNFSACQRNPYSLHRFSLQKQKWFRKWQHYLKQKGNGFKVLGHMEEISIKL